MVFQFETPRCFMVWFLSCFGNTLRAYLPKLQQQLLETQVEVLSVVPLFGKRINRGWIAFNSRENLLRKNMDLKLFEPEHMVSNRVMIKKDMGGDQKFASVESRIRKKVVDKFGNLEMMKNIASNHRKSLSISGSDDTTVEKPLFLLLPSFFQFSTCRAWNSVHQDNWSQADEIFHPFTGGSSYESEGGNPHSYTMWGP